MRPIFNIVERNGKENLLTYGWRLRYLAWRADRAQARYQRASDKAWAADGQEGV